MIDFVQQQKQSREVYHATNERFFLSASDIEQLVALAEKNDRQRVRFCAHVSPTDLAQQMFIVHPLGAYIRPHMHKNKAESMLVLEGVVDYVTFSLSGDIDEVTSMGSYNSGKPFFQSIDAEVFHTLIIRSKWLVFVEVTKGPFSRLDTVFAEWSPPESENSLVGEYMKLLDQRLVVE